MSMKLHNIRLPDGRGVPVPYEDEPTALELSADDQADAYHKKCMALAGYGNAEPTLPAKIRRLIGNLVATCARPAGYRDFSDAERQLRRACTKKTDAGNLQPDHAMYEAAVREWGRQTGYPVPENLGAPASI
jgi:hypothetical protein